MMAIFSPHHRLGPQSFKQRYLATLSEDTEVPVPTEPLDDHDPLVLQVDRKVEPVLALKHRSKSESFICTAQGIVFEDNQSEYSSKLDQLVALAANLNAQGTRSNVLLAKKALRFRKAIGRRRNESYQIAV
ncbi:uncharacterized protein PHALS_05426 [Plasmopara halstedii]|uniref:Uncharacterized protein n=1 Tax=Plasmopara halstedii TaxID=4781 RepID=A0A0P1AAF1_PLAHL|nr:uncharacterized protein PHALS_05426 [Plasmopara halstedii]CEG37648.1 hypothetical protein PHALS_05426 [Plasmopara halstedii]|eukprot:XP_024574017.1 hypothetical protein PHALS_05426 [Plasmopara halstedii]